MANQPIEKYMAGPVTATIWANEQQDNNGNNFTQYSVKIDRNYKDQDGHWQNTPSMRVSDLPRVELVTRKAFEYLNLKDLETLKQQQQAAQQGQQPQGGQQPAPQ